MLTTMTQLTDDSGAFTFSSVQDVSDDASRVVMLSDQNIDDGNPDGAVQVFLHNRATDTTEQLTAHSRGSVSSPTVDLGGSISSDGLQVVFSSPGDSLPGSNSDGGLEVYLYSVDTALYVQLT
jgi:hypothetical protein